MDIKIILLYKDRFVKIISQGQSYCLGLKSNIFDEVIKSNLLNDIEKFDYLQFVHSNKIMGNINNGDETIEIFINPTHPNRKAFHTANYNYCKIFNYDEDVIVRFANNLLYLDHGKLLYNLCILNTEYYKSKVRTECPICYDNTSCYEFFKCDHVQCFDCYLQMKKFKCALCRSD
jgi:hypothetical protein